MNSHVEEHKRHRAMTAGIKAEKFFGPAFCLSLELGFAGNDAHVAAALSALWSCSNVEGPWAEEDDIGRVTPCDDLIGRFGLLTSELIEHPLPFRRSMIREACAELPERLGAEHPMRVQFGVQTQDPSDWLTLDVPVPILSSIWRVDGTWATNSQPWLPPFCRAFAAVADHVHTNAPILGGVMGEEASGCWRVPTPVRIGEAEQDYPPLAVLTAGAIERRGGFLVTPSLWQRLAPRATAISLSSGLLYVLPNATAPLTGA